MSPIPRPNDGSDYTRHFGRIADFERRRSDLVVFSLPFFMCMCGEERESRIFIENSLQIERSQFGLIHYAFHSLGD